MTRPRTTGFSIPRRLADQVRDPEDRQSVIAIVAAALASSTIAVFVLLAARAVG